VKAPKPAKPRSTTSWPSVRRRGSGRAEGPDRERLGAEYGAGPRGDQAQAAGCAGRAGELRAAPSSLVEAEAKQIAHQLWHEEHPEVQGHDHPEIEPTDEHARLAERRVRLGLLLAEIGRRPKSRSPTPR
jgi:trigger factor